MGRVSILDCTLRDGGYINQWKYGEQTIKDIIRKIEQSGVGIIECGFLKDDEYDVNSTVFPNENEMSKSFEKKPNEMYVGMIALGDINTDKLGKCTPGGIDGIRLTFHKDEIEEEFCQAKTLMKKGYKVFIQPVGTTSYSDKELIELVGRVNSLHPYAFYIVDTLGVMFPEDIARLYSIVNHNLDSNVVVGFHSHNNLQLSFANAQLFISEGMKREAGIIVDSSISGMGRGAGNLPTELIVQYLNKIYGHMYNPLPLLTVADQYLNKIFMNTPWGYSSPYYLSAINNCHPNYSTFLLTKKTVGIEDIAKILNLIPDNSRELFDKELIESLYFNYQKSEYDDSTDLSAIKRKMDNREILVIASGNSITINRKEIHSWINDHNCVVIHINTVKEGYPADILFISNSKIAQSGILRGSRPIVIASSNVDMELVKPDYRVNYSSLLGNYSELDNAGLMFLTLLTKIGIKQVTVAGFDGFTHDSGDYLEFVSSSYRQRDLDHRNDEISRELRRLSSVLEIKSITPTLYDLGVKSNEKVTNI